MNDLGHQLILGLKFFLHKLTSFFKVCWIHVNRLRISLFCQWIEASVKELDYSRIGLGVMEFGQWYQQ